MAKRLEEMTLEELWELFPIVLVEYNPIWTVWADEEVGFLSEALALIEPVINHVGSTAIAGIMSKPIVDLLVEVGPEADFAAVAKAICGAGYICMAESASRMSFNKGYTTEGYAERVFHLHLRRAGDNDEIFFRDYLRAHPETARAYQRLKLSLLPRYRNNRDAYTAAKTDFVKGVLARRDR